MSITGNKGVYFDNAISNTDFRVSDLTGKQAFITTFGQLVVSNKDSQIVEQFAYGLPSTGVITETTGTGYIETSDSLLKVGALAGVGTASVESLQSVRYVPGSMAYSFFTTKGFPVGVTGTSAYMGLFDSEDGFAIGVDDGVPCVLRRRFDGTQAVDYHTHIDEYIDKLDGTGESKYVVDWSKGQIFAITFAYLGFAPISFLIKTDDDKWIEFCKIKYPNNYTETHISMPYLPLRLEVSNNSAQDIEIGSGSVDAGIFNGGKTDPSLNYSEVAMSAPTTTTTSDYFVAIRGSQLIESRKNKIASLLHNLSISTDGSTKDIRIKVIKNPTLITDGTWTSLGNASPLEYTTDAVFDLNSGFNTGITRVIKKADVTVFNADTFDTLVRRGEYLVFKFSSTNGTISDFSVGFKDLY